MNEKEFEALAKQAGDAMQVFRRIQSLKMAPEILAPMGAIPPTRFISIQFDIEYTEANGMVNWKTFRVAQGDLFFNRTVRDFVAMAAGISKEAQEKFATVEPL